MNGYGDSPTVPAALQVRSWGDAVRFGLIAAGVGMLVLGFGGFKLGGWYTGGQAKVLAEKTADARVLQTLIPICADTFMRMPDASARLAVLIKTESYSRNPVVEKGLVIPGQKSFDYQLLSACADNLVEQAKKSDKSAQK